jgi:hypothetical protein
MVNNICHVRNPWIKILSKFYKSGFPFSFRESETSALSSESSSRLLVLKISELQGGREVLHTLLPFLHKMF